MAIYLDLYDDDDDVDDDMMILISPIKPKLKAT